MNTPHAVPESADTDRLVCRAELAQLPRLLALVSGLCERERIDGASGHALTLIAEEACVNVMRHAYPPGQAGPLSLSVAIETEGGQRLARLTLEDQGRPFDPLSVPEVDTGAALSAREPGGLGVLLIRRLSDRQRYRRDPQLGNVFTIHKSLPPTIPPAQESSVQITTTAHGAVLAVAITGSIDSLNADELSARFAACIAAGQTRLVADFSRVNYTSSAGLRALLGTVKSCRLAGGDLRMAAVQPQVRRVLDIAGFSSILSIYPALDEALESFAEAA